MKTCKSRLKIFLLLTIFLFAGGCSQSTDTLVENNTQDKIQVVVSILPQADFVKKIAGDQVEVTVMIPPGASPASYEPSPGQLKKLSQSQLYIKIGHIPFEKAWMNKIIAANPDMKVLDSSTGIEIINNNPHIWLSPQLVKIQTETICQALLELDPENADFYKDKRDKFIKELDALDQEIKNSLDEMNTNTFMTFHPSWLYFARDYGLQEIAVEIDGKEPTSRDLQSLIKQARENNIHYIFASPQFNRKSADLIAREINGKVIMIDPLPEDYIKSMKEISQAFTMELKD